MAGALTDLRLPS